MNRSVVVISRDWHNPHIKVVVTQEDINVSMPLDDFIQALASEVGNPTTMVTQPQLLKRLKSAGETVLRGMKQVTAKVM